ncbi:MAG: PTS sugar transporter subunit IIA [Planctomycetota bacterium]
MKLSELIHADSVITELQATDRNDVIRELVQSLADTGGIDASQAESVIEEAIARENQGSTGFGKGVAVPHVKLEGLKQLRATIGRSSHGIDFAALDRAPVYTVLMLLSPKDRPEDHLSAMELIFQHLQRDNFRKFMRQAESKEAILDLIQEADEMQEEA